mmetsp:Transcript_124721/g.349323  ORF Transcript_124721/g.349323 Transcript_124721/m.349323 type:complete len:88 (+) Transcript_124721:274-537(+)
MTGWGGPSGRIARAAQFDDHTWAISVPVSCTRRRRAKDARKCVTMVTTDTINAVEATQAATRVARMSFGLLDGALDVAGGAACGLPS